MVMVLLLLDLDEMGNLGDHAADLGPVGQRVAAPDTTQPQCTQRASLLGFDADHRSGLGDFQICHRSSSSVRGAALALLISTPEAAGDELVGGEAARSRHLV